MAQRSFVPKMLSRFLRYCVFADMMSGVPLR